MPAFFTLFVLLIVGGAACIIFDPPFLRRPLDRLVRSWRGEPASNFHHIVSAAHPPNRCNAIMRATESISCYWQCELAPFHDGLHEWHCGVVVVQFTTEQARMSWQGDANRNVVPSFYGPRPDGAA